jgi:chromosome segregation ATPase
VAKKIMIDKLSEDITEKSQSLEEKTVTIEYFTAENSDLTEQLQKSTAERNCLKVEIESLVASNKEYVQQISVLEEDLAAKKSVNNEMREDIKNKSKSIEEKSAEIANLTKQLHTSNAENNGLKKEIESLIASNKMNVKKLTSAIDRMSHDIQHKIELLDENSAEIAALSEQLNDSKIESYKLKVEIESLVAGNDEKVQHISTLDSDLMVKKGVIDELSEEMQHKNVLLEAKTVKIAFLVERIQLSKVESDGLKEEVEALVARNDEIALTLRLNEDVLLAKKITIDKMTEDIELKSTLLKEKEAEILDLSEQLQFTKAEKKRFMSEIESLMTSKKENVEILTTAIDGLTDDIERKSKMLEVLSDQNNDLAEQLKRCKAESYELKTKVESLTAYKQVNIEHVSLLEKDLAAKKVMIDELTKDIQHYRDHW